LIYAEKGEGEGERMLKKVLPLTMLAIMVLGLFNLPVTLASPIATFYVEATKTTGLDIDEEFWVIIKFKDFEQLWMWQAGLQWEPDKLECLEVVAFKPYYPESVFAVLAPTRSTAFIDGTIDNTAGKIYPPYAESLKAPGEGVTGTAGVGYPILKARFKVEAYFPDGTTLTPLETEWTAYPNVGTFLPHEDQPLTIYTKTPPAPYGPTAKFSWTPVFPTEGETVTFDGSASKGGFDGTSTRPITEFRWDFESDGTWDAWGPPDTHKIVTHVYPIAGDYAVTLEVYAPGAVPETNSTTKTIKVLPPAMGAQIDLYCQKAPFDGKGPDVESDAFAPQELVILYAKVTYNGDPVSDKLVAFQVNSSDGQAILYRVDDTDSDGIAVVEFRIPSKPPNGTWLAWAIVDVAQTTVADTMPFKVGWIVEILSVTPQANTYKKGETAKFDLEIKNIAKTSKTPTITIVVYDAVGVPIGWYVIPEWYIEPEVTAPITMEIDIPLTAFKSPPSAMVFANAFTDLPSNNGVPYCPEASASFIIESP
jgi:PKD repeat protein